MPQRVPLPPSPGPGPVRVAVWRPSDRTWYVRLRPLDQPETFLYGLPFGQAGDAPVPADYDGDGRADIAVLRPSGPVASAVAPNTWFIGNQRAAFLFPPVQWGLSEDIPVPADYTGDGRAEIAVWRPSDRKWCIRGPNDSFLFGAPQFGQVGDIPVPADYDGDGRAEIAVWRPSDGTWHVRQQDGTESVVPFGQAGDIPVPADYDGDGRARIAVWRPSDGTWRIRQQDGTESRVVLGQTDDIPVPGDYDGDGRAEIAVWRPSDGTWHIRQHEGTERTVQFGQAGDIPVPAAYAALRTDCPAAKPGEVLRSRDPRPANLRQLVAAASATLQNADSQANGEEGAYPTYPYQANYTKGLPKEPNGRADVQPAAYRTLITILEQARQGNRPIFAGIPIGTPIPGQRTRKLTNPQAGVAFDLEGPDAFAVDLGLLSNPATSPRPASRSLRPAPRIDGNDTEGRRDYENAAEMVELYWMALMRDVHFADYTGTGDPPPDAPAGWPRGNLARQTADDLNGILPRPSSAPADIRRFRLHHAFREPYPTDPSQPDPLNPGRFLVSPATIYRGSAPGDKVGPFISQFLLRGTTSVNASGGTVKVLRRPEDGMVSHGTQTMNQRQTTVGAFRDYLMDTGSWRNVQAGANNPSGTDDLEPPPIFIRNLRDLANWVHVDYQFQHFLNAALTLLNEPPQVDVNDPVVGLAAPDAKDFAPLAGRPDQPGPVPRPPPFPLDPGNPYVGGPDAVNQIGFGTFGDPHMLTLLSEVNTRATKAVWYQKWYVHRRNRPEEFGGLVHFQKGSPRTPTDPGPYPCIDPVILDRDNLLRLVQQRNKLPPPFGGGEATYLLPQVFPEGSPTHPAYGSGHATVVGACATILKAYFDEDAPMTDPTNNDPATMPTDISKLPRALVSNPDGTRLVAAQGREQAVLTVGGELNKLASNIAIGRNGAGVHWRSDATQGMALGEAVATGLLYEQAFTFNELHSFTFTTFFTGLKVRIARERVGTGPRTRVTLRVVPAATDNADIDAIEPVAEQEVEDGTA